jgi:hypothetical protein
MESQALLSLGGTWLAAISLLLVGSVALFVFAMLRIRRMEDKWSFLENRILERTTKSTTFHEKQTEVLLDLAQRLEDTFNAVLKWITGERSALTGLTNDQYKGMFHTVDTLSDYYRSVEFFVTDDDLRKDMNEFFRRSYESLVLRMSAEVSGPDYDQKGLPLAAESLTSFEAGLYAKITKNIEKLKRKAKRS